MARLSPIHNNPTAKPNGQFNPPIRFPQLHTTMPEIEFTNQCKPWCLAHLAAIGDLFELLDIPFGSHINVSGIAAGTCAILTVVYLDPKTDTFRTGRGRIVLFNDPLQSRHITIK